MNSYPLIMRFLGLDESELINRIHQVLDDSHSHYFIKLVHNELVLEVMGSVSSAFHLRRAIIKPLWHFFVGYGTGTVESTVGHKLIQNHLTVTSAESLTCGLFQSTLGRIPGISSVFSGGFVTYSDYIKHRLLSIPSKVIRENGVVSKPTAIWMAKQSQFIMKTDLAISFTGVAGPSPLEGHSSGTVWIGLAYHHHYGAKLYQLNLLCSELTQYYRKCAALTDVRSLQRNMIRRLSVKMGFKMINDKLRANGY